MPKLTDPDVEDAIIALLLRLGPYYPLKTESHESFLRRLTHDERVLLVIERLSSKLREAKRDRRERPVQPVPDSELFSCPACGVPVDLMAGKLG